MLSVILRSAAEWLHFGLFAVKTTFIFTAFAEWLLDYVLILAALGWSDAVIKTAGQILRSRFFTIP